jgi:predicted lipoprotein with Yx(FWY)xxD motif
MKRIVILLAVFAAALATAGLATAGGHRAKVNLRKTRAGKLLVNSRGVTLYEFAKDAKNKDNCVAIPNCTTVWPPLYTSGKPVARKGVRRSLLGTITLHNGRQQVTYGGFPLYTYLGDGKKPGAITGVGIVQSRGRWYGVTAAGHRVSKK